MAGKIRARRRELAASAELAACDVDQGLLLAPPALAVLGSARLDDVATYGARTLLALVRAPVSAASSFDRPTLDRGFDVAPTFSLDPAVFDNLRNLTLAVGDVLVDAGAGELLLALQQALRDPRAGAHVVWPPVATNAVQYGVALLEATRVAVRVPTSLLGLVRDQLGAGPLIAVWAAAAPVTDEVRQNAIVRNARPRWAMMPKKRPP